MSDEPEAQPVRRAYRFETLRDLDQAGLDLRVWCYGCGRAVDVWSHRGWDFDIVATARAE